MNGPCSIEERSVKFPFFYRKNKKSKKSHYFRPFFPLFESRNIIKNIRSLRIPPFRSRSAAKFYRFSLLFVFAPCFSLMESAAPINLTGAYRQKWISNDFIAFLDNWSIRFFFHFFFSSPYNIRSRKLSTSL
jgi:hypothetical protein